MAGKKKKLGKLARQTASEKGISYQQALEELRSQLCEACRLNAGKEHLRERSIREWYEPDEDATEGQIADYFCELENPDIGSNWSDVVVETFCPECEKKARKVLGELESRFGRPMGTLLNELLARPGTGPITIVHGDGDFDFEAEED